MSEIDEGALGRVLDDLADQLRKTIEQVVAENASRTVDEATFILQRALDFAGFQCDETWCRNAIGTVRRGEFLTIHLS